MKLSSLLRFIIRKIMDEPDDRVIILEILPDEEYEYIETEDYSFYKYGKNHIEYDSIEKFDGEPVFSTDFGFLNEIAKGCIKDKIKIDKTLIGVNKIKTTIRRTLNKTDFELTGAKFNIYICDVELAKIQRKIRYSITSFDDDILKLEDMDGYEEEINLGRK